VELIDSPASDTPDACFPNNVFSMHSLPPLMITYPMLSANRRREFIAIESYLSSTLTASASEETTTASSASSSASASAEETAETAEVVKSHHHKLIDRLDLSDQPPLEGTGSLVFDHLGRRAYMALSKRSTESTARTVCDRLGYALIPFHATDADNVVIYHTNVCLAIGTHWAVLCGECLRNDEEKAALVRSLEGTDENGRRTVILISMEQMKSFAGNCLEILTGDQRLVTVMSDRARQSLSADQFTAWTRISPIYSVPLTRIEQIGGGGVRCCIAELFC